LGSPWHAYANAKSNGILNLDDPNAPTLDEAKLVAVVTDLSLEKAISAHPVSVHDAIKDTLNLGEDPLAALTEGQGVYSEIPDEEESSADFDLVA
jgi:hypothetical protein